MATRKFQENMDGDYRYRSEYWNRAVWTNTFFPNEMPEDNTSWNQFGRAANQQKYWADEAKRQRAFNLTKANAKGSEAVASKGLKNGLFGKYGFGIWAGVSAVGNMKNGDNFGTAVVKGFGEAMLWETAPLAMTAWSLASAAPSVISAGYNWYRQRDFWFRNQHLPNFGGMYQDTQRAMTMRQAAIQAIQGSKLNARSALGGEARILSQGMYRQNTY